MWLSGQCRPWVSFKLFLMNHEYNPPPPSLHFHYIANTVQFFTCGRWEAREGKWGKRSGSWSSRCTPHSPYISHLCYWTRTDLQRIVFKVATSKKLDCKYLWNRHLDRLTNSCSPGLNYFLWTKGIKRTYQEITITLALGELLLGVWNWPSNSIQYWRYERVELYLHSPFHLQEFSWISLIRLWKETTENACNSTNPPHTCVGEVAGGGSCVVIM